MAKIVIKEDGDGHYIEGKVVSFDSTGLDLGGGGGGDGTVETIAAGSYVVVDNTDPANPNVGVDSGALATAFVPYSGATQPLDLGQGNTLHVDSIVPSTEDGGTVSIQGAQATTDGEIGGGVYIAAAPSQGAADGGDVTLAAGYADPAVATGTGNGGNIILNPGPAEGDGEPGHLKVIDDSKSHAGILDMGTLGDDRIYTFPDKTGTLAMLDDVGGGGSSQSPYDAVVAPSGGDYTTLSDAIAAASDGWAILVLPGTYTEAGFSTALEGISVSGLNAQSSILEFGSNSAVFENFTSNNTIVSGLGFTFTTGGFASHSDYFIARDCTFTKTGGTADCFDVSGAFAIVENNLFDTMSWTTASTASVLNMGGSYMKVRNNTFRVNNNHSTTGEGAIMFQGSGTVSDNTFLNYGSAAYDLVFVNNSTIFVDNSLFDLAATATGNMINLVGPLAVIKGNIIQGNNMGGIGTAGSSSQNVISSNTISCKNGIRIASGGQGNIVIGNEVNGSSTSGSTVGISAASANTAITGNYVSFFHTGIQITSGSTKSTVTGNISLNSTTNYADSGTTTTATGNITS